MPFCESFKSASTEETDNGELSRGNALCTETSTEYVIIIIIVSLTFATVV
jgi:hypothetical protein